MFSDTYFLRHLSCSLESSWTRIRCHIVLQRTQRLKTSSIKILHICYWLFSCNMILLVSGWSVFYFRTDSECLSVKSSPDCCRVWAHFSFFLWSLSTDLRNICVRLSSSETLTDWLQQEMTLMISCGFNHILTLRSPVWYSGLFSRL